MEDPKDDIKRFIDATLFQSKVFNTHERAMLILTYVWGFTGLEISYCFGFTAKHVSITLKSAEKKVLMVKKAQDGQC